MILWSTLYQNSSRPGWSGENWRPCHQNLPRGYQEGYQLVQWTQFNFNRAATTKNPGPKPTKEKLDLNPT